MVIFVKNFMKAYHAMKEYCKNNPENTEVAHIFKMFGDSVGYTCDGKGKVTE